MTKKLFIVVVLLVVALFIIVFAAHGLGGRSTTTWGKDTVKQFNNGSFEILRSSSKYCFHSSDDKVYLDGITHYYDNGLDLYLMGSKNLYARVDTVNEIVETHSSVNEFSSDDQRIFDEGNFIKLPEIGTSRNIWDILFKK